LRTAVKLGFMLKSEMILKAGLKRLATWMMKRNIESIQEKQKKEQESMTQEKDLMIWSRGLEKRFMNTDKDDIYK